MQTMDRTVHENKIKNIHETLHVLG